MKLAVLSVICLLNISAQANQMPQCKTMLDGQCVQYYNSNSNQRCKTMIDGQCIEYYNMLPEGNSNTSYYNYNNQNNNYNNQYYRETIPTKTVKRPQWSDIAPLEWENPQHYNVAFTNRQFDSNDWYKLKQEFEGLLAKCDAKTGEAQNACYEKLVYEETYKLNNFTSTREKWNQWSEKFQHQMDKDKIINSAVNNKNSRVFMQVPY